MIHLHYGGGSYNIRWREHYFFGSTAKKIIHYYIRLHLYILYGDIFLRDITDFWASVHPLIVLNLPAVFSRGQYSYILRERSLHTLMPPRRNVPEIRHYCVNDPAPPGEVQYSDLDSQLTHPTLWFIITVSGTAPLVLTLLCMFVRVCTIRCWEL
jgi:hypothetical protein